MTYVEVDSFYLLTFAHLLVDCRSQIVTTDAAGDVCVFPTNRLRVGGIGVDVAAQFARQIGHRGEHTTRDDVALDFGEPQFDLIQP